MTTPPAIDEAMVAELVDANRALIDTVRKAIGDFHASPPVGWQAWETWRKPEVWTDAVLPSLEKYLRLAEAGFSKFRQGDPSGAFAAGSAELGLTRHLDNYDLSWATPENRKALDDAVDRAARAADRIWRVEFARRPPKP